jgi:Ca2+-binding RTX toxin-like protein
MHLPSTVHRATKLSVILFVAAAALPAPAAAAVPRCFGERATIVGTPGDDVLRGTRQADVIVGRAGDDTIRGKGRGDLICGGGGNDSVFGGGGSDMTLGGAGDDGFFGQGGVDSAVPGPGDDFVDGGPGAEDEVNYLNASGPITGDLGAGVIGGHGNDQVVNVEWLIGGPFDDLLTGTEGNDALFGADGNDWLEALGGDDFLAGGAGDDAIDGGTGSDFLGNYFFPFYYLGSSPPGPITIDLPGGTLTGEGTDSLVSIEGGQGSTGDDVMIGNAEDNEFTGLLDGDDTVDSGDGDDLVDGGDGVDDLDGGAGFDVLGNIDATDGMTIDLTTQTDSHGDTLAGFDGAWGTFFDDVITGTDGPNELVGVDGADHMFGFAGDDVLIGGFFTYVDPDVDTADGGLGIDQCDAERETNCESDPPPMVDLPRRPIPPTPTAAGSRFPATASPTTPAWVKHYNGPGDRFDWAKAIDVSPDGSTVFVTGQSFGGPETREDYATVAYDAATGTRLWASRYDGPGHGYDSASAQGMSPDGQTVFVTGWSSATRGGSTGDDDWATVAYDAATGATLWVSRYDGPVGNTDIANAIAVSSDGSIVFVTGLSYGGSALAFNADSATVAYDAASGAVRWVSRYDGPASEGDSTSAIDVSADGSTVFVGGSTYGGSTRFDYLTMALHADTGLVQWASSYDGPAGFGDFTTDLVVSPDGSGVFVTGRSHRTPFDIDSATVAYDAGTGAQSWVRRYKGAIVALDVAPDSTSVFAAASNAADFVTFAYDTSDGGQQWRSRYDGPGSLSDAPVDLAVSRDGGLVYVTGSSYDGAASVPSADLATFALGAATGDRRWAMRYAGPHHADDRPTALVVSPDGRAVFVTGLTGRFSAGRFSTNWVTVAHRVV